ncbi:hypothetical protein HY251_05220 [bacterium]|nr:hypothetical protein [bacterium]
MQRIRRPLVCLLAGLAAASAGCHSYYRAAERTRPQNPHAACEYLAKCLEDDPNDEDAIKLLNEIGKKIAVDHSEQVAELERSGRYEDAVAQCDRVIATRVLIAQLPGKVDVVHEAEERSKNAVQAAAKAYAVGLNLEKQHDQKGAARRFRVAMAFVPGYRDAPAHYAAMVKAATLRCAFAGFHGNNYGRSLARDAGERFKNKIVEMNPEFLEIVGANDASARGRLTGVIDADYGDTGWVGTRGRNSIQVNDTNPDGTWKVDANGNFIFKTVSASWVVYDRTTSMTLTIKYEIVDAKTGGSLDAGQFSANDSDSGRYAGDFRGDMNAVPYDVQGMSRDRPGLRTFQDLAKPKVEVAVDEMSAKVFRRFK